MTDPLEVVTPPAAPNPREVSAVIDYVIATACSMAPARVTARAQNEGRSTGTTAWVITKRGSEETEELCRYPAEFFRSCLARIGHHYLDGQLYGGYGRRWLRVDGENYAAAIYLSNEGFSGFWVDIYLAPLENRAMANPALNPPGVRPAG